MNLIKVIRQTEDGLASCVMGQPGLEQIYVPGQWAVAHIGGFFAFTVLEHAMSFKKRYDYIADRGHLQLWNAQCDNSDVIPTPPSVPSSVSREPYIRFFWDEWLTKNNNVFGPVCTWPGTAIVTWPGTAIVKRLRLTERIDMSEIGQGDKSHNG